MGLNIIGISALYHDSACCLLKDGKLIAAVEEERFTRHKNDGRIPKHAFRFCLEEGGLTLPEIDYIAYYENPHKKVARQFWSGIWPNSDELAYRLNPQRPEIEIRNILGYEGPIKYFEHHQSHAASSFYFSGFEEAAIMTFDGVGEWTTTSYGAGNSSGIELFEEVSFPNSLGLLYSTITSFLGFSVNSDEYKVMGLAPYGKAVYKKQMYELIESLEGGQYRLDLKYFNFSDSKLMYTPLMVDLFKHLPREEKEPINQFHKDVARSLQVVLEEILIEKAFYFHKKTGMENLCMAGGVALNCVANGRILKEGPFKKMFVQPASGDAGAALGAAAELHFSLTQEKKQLKLEHVYLGPEYSMDEIERILNSTSFNFLSCKGNTSQLLEETAKRLADKKVIGWFNGKMEFGPRSLGARSILADPRDPEMRDRINHMVKKREGFRPFAPAILATEVEHYFDLDHASPFMLETCQVISSLDLPAITHVDGSARVQTVTEESNPRFASLLKAFQHLTGCPILLNTSFNVKGEPIVCSPVDAIECFISTNIDCLVLGDFIIDRSQNEMHKLEEKYKLPISTADVKNDVYTFI